MGTISRNFSYSEFERSDVAARFHIVNCINTAEIRDAVKALVENVLQPLRDAWGAPLFISSGYRSPELNSHPLVGGVPTSQHTKGEAADVACSSPIDLARLAVEIDVPFDQMIVYPSFVHFSYKQDGENRGQIIYAKKYRGERI